MRTDAGTASERQRQAFLENVRRALGQTRSNGSAAAAGTGERTNARPVQPENNRERAAQAKSQDNALEVFCRRAREAGMTVVRCGSPAALGEEVRGLLRRLGATAVLLEDDPLLRELGVAEAARGAGAQTTSGGGAAAALAADVGISAAAAGLVETGSVVLTTGAGRSRLGSVAPPVHLTILPAARLCRDWSELWARVAGGPGVELPALVTLVTGPSKTADIEMTTVIGAHGPLAEYVFVVG